MKDSHVFYAGVHDPKQLRKDVLVSQKAILDSLKKFEHLRQLRAEKELRIAELKKMLSALRIISSQFKTRLPASAIKMAPKPKPLPEPEPMPVVRKQPVQKKPPVHHKTKLEILEEELARIESKLSSIE